MNELRMNTPTAIVPTIENDLLNCYEMLNKFQWTLPSCPTIQCFRYYIIISSLVIYTYQWN